MRWRNTKEYRSWRKKCIERDGNKCAITGLTTRLEVHHLNSARYFPEQKFDVDNGITIHKYVHLLFHIYYKMGYRKKCTKKDWKRFLKGFKRYRFLFKLINMSNEK